MIVFLNGRFVPEEEALVSAFDRGFLLGDGLFETVPIHGGRPFCGRQHLWRLLAGARRLGIRLPCSEAGLTRDVGELIARNRVAEGVLRLTLTRGPGGGGYSPRNDAPATLVMAVRSGAAVDPGQLPRWRLATATFRVPPGSALAECKHTSRIHHVLARAEAETRGCDDALLLNTADQVVEAASGNAFWIERQTIGTPPLSAGALAGITRSLVLGLCRDLGLSTRIEPVKTEALRRAEGVFVTLSTLGIVEIVALDGQPLATSPLTARIREAYWSTVDAFRSGADAGLDRRCVFPPTE